MSNAVKGIIAVVIIIILIVVFMLGLKKNPTTPVPVDTSAVNSGENMETGGNSASVSSQSTTDASLDKDIGSVDAEMSALSTDSANADQGLNDKPIDQAE